MRTLILACFAASLLACSSSSGGSGGGGGGSATGGASAGGGGASTGGSSASGGGGAGGTSASGGGGSGGAAADTWDDFAMQFFASYCVECHDPTDAARDYNKLADVTRDSAAIRCGVAPVQESGCGASPAPKQFPIGSGPKPTDDERARIVKWIDAGTP